MPETYDVKITSSAETRALENYAKILADSVASARAAGLETKSLEKELAGVNRQLAQGKLRDHAASLKEAITQTRAAGQSTAELERRLKQIDGMRPQGSVAKFFSGIRDALRDIPGIGGFIGAFNGASAAVAAGAGLAVAGVAKLVGALKQFAGSGIEFNSKLETATLGVAAVFKQFDKTGKFENFDAAMRASAQAIELLKAAASSSPASFEQLLQAYQGTAGSMASTGMSIEQQIDTIKLMSQTLAGLGIRPDQMLQETRAILTGNITEDALAAKTLGITPESIRSAKEQGNLYEFLQEKMAGFAEAGARAGDTLSVKWSNVGDNLQQISANLTTGLFEGIKTGAGNLNELLETINKWTGGGAKADTAPIVSEAEKAAQAVRDLNQSRLDDLAKQAAGAAGEFEKLEKNIEGAFKMLLALAAAKSKLALATTDREEQEALAGVSDPKQQAAIKRQFSEKRIHLGYDADLTEINLQKDQQMSVIAAARARESAADKIAERANLLKMGAESQFDLASASVPDDLRADAKKRAAAITSLTEAAIPLEKALELAVKSRSQVSSAGDLLFGSGHSPQEVAAALKDEAKNRAELADINARLDPLRAFETAQSAAAAADAKATKAQADAATVGDTTQAATVAAEKQLKLLELQKKTIGEKAAGDLLSLRNEAAQDGVSATREARDRKLELQLMDATARNDKAGIRKATWTRDYWAEYDKGGVDWEARQMADAKRGSANSFSASFSSRASGGNDMEENLAIARAALAAGVRGISKENDPIADVAKNTSQALAKLDAVTQAINNLPSDRPGYFNRR